MPALPSGRHATAPARADEARLRESIAAVARGDEAAFERVVDALHGDAYRLALRILGDRHDAEEATLDALHQVWRAAASYDPAVAPPRAWVLVLVRCRALDRRRSARARRAPERPLDDAAYADVVDQAACAATAEHDEALERLLDALPADERDVLALAYAGGCTQAEISRRLDQPLGTVKTRMRRGLARLRRTLAPAARP